MPHQDFSLQEPTDGAMASSSKPSKNADTNNLSSRDKRKSANRARHRLLSIQYDVEHYLKPLLQQQHQQHDPSSYSADSHAKPIVIVANERCGTWYALPFAPQSYCHFKSTDGHVHFFSLKRLNLPLLRTLAQAHQKGQTVWILDASNKKEMPDSFSRTLPIWCVVLNRIALRYRRELGILLDENAVESEEEDYKLFVPRWIVPLEERATMEAVIHDRVEELYQSRAIVDVPGFLQCMIKPLRPFWITPLHLELPTQGQQKTTMPVVCCNASHIRLNPLATTTKGENETAAFKNDQKGNTSRIVWMQDEEFWYTPGAADDQESWARHLTPQLFWDHCQNDNDNANHKEDATPQRTTDQMQQSTLPFSSSMTDQEVDEWIDVIVKEARGASSGDTNEASGDQDCFDWIGNLHLAIGSRRAGRPPHCWVHFDAILNVTNTEYDDIRQSTTEGVDDRFYLQLPVEEGKRDRQELERWMTVGVMFCAYHTSQNRRILIHCAQGRDRSVAVVMAVVQIFCNSRYPLEWNRNLLDSTLSQLLLPIHSDTHGDSHTDSLATRIDESGLPRHCVANFLDQEGRDRLLNGVRGQVSKSESAPLASKESLRVVLHLIRQDREKAEPTRSTLQKLNRFFMSDAYRKP